MKNIFAVFLIVLCLGSLFYSGAQMPATQNFILVDSTPSGSCDSSSPAELLIGAGSIYTCQSNTWSTVGGGGGTWPGYPGAGLVVSTGSAWGTSKTSPSGTVVGTTDTQTLTNKTVDGVTPTVMGYVDPTSSIQTQLNAKASSSAATTVNGQTCTLGSTCTVPFQTNSSGNTSQAGINLETSTTNAVGLTVTPTNTATNVEKFEITGGSYTGNSAGVTNFTTPTAGGSAILAQTVASGTVTVNPGAISSGACSSAITATATGTTTTDVIQFNFNADPTGTTGYAPSASGSLFIYAYPTSNTVNFKVCNNTSGPITPTSTTLNWRVPR